MQFFLSLLLLSSHFKNSVAITNDQSVREETQAVSNVGSEPPVSFPYTVATEEYYGVGRKKENLECSLTVRLRQKTEPRQAPGSVTSSFRVGRDGMVIQGAFGQCSGDYIQEVHSKPIPPKIDAPQASVGSGHANTIWDLQNGSPLIEKHRIYGADPTYSAPFTLEGTRTLVEPETKTDQTDVATDEDSKASKQRVN